MKNKDTGKNVLRIRRLPNAVICVSALTLFVSLTMLFCDLTEYKKGDEAYNALQTIVLSNEKSYAASQEGAYHLSEPQERSRPWTDSEEQQRIIVDFAALQGENPDIVGWLMSEDGHINYPIAQGSDNQYYLDHLFDKTPNEAGCLFIDYMNASDFSDRNTVIYHFDKHHSFRDTPYLSHVRRPCNAVRVLVGRRVILAAMFDGNNGAEKPPNCAV